MVLFLLYIKAELENVGSVTLKPDVNLCINVRNPLSDYEVREKVVMNPSQVLDQDEGAREPEHHLRLKWDGANKPSYAIILTPDQVKTMLKKKGGNKKGGKGGDAANTMIPRDYTAQDSGEWIPLLAMDCRGLEPYGFFPMGGEFVITSDGGGKQFDDGDIDLGEGDWADYDDEQDVPVSMSEIQFKWEAVG
ncbi:hypothetical protein ACA910_012253 [Epithemia clementina (nom. ined.)]